MKKIELFFLVLIFLSAFLPGFSAIDKMAFQWLYLAIVVCIYILFKLIINSKDSPFPLILNKSIYSILILFIISLLSLINASNLSESTIELSRLFIIISLLFTFVSINSNLKIDHLFIFKLFNVLLILECLYFFFSLYYFYNSYGIINFKGVSTNVNIQAFSILLKLPILIYSFYSNYISKFLYYLVSIFSIAIILLISSRAALFGLICIYSYYIITNNKGYFKSFLQSLTLLISSFLLTNFIVLPYLSSTSKLSSLSLVNISTLSRLEYYKEAFSTILNYPLFGIGIGNWKIFGIGMHSSQISSYTTPYHVHNDFLQFGAETGIFGFIAFLCFIVFSIVYAIKLRNHKYFKSLFAPFSLIIFIYILDSSLNFPISRPLIQIQFLFYLSCIFYFYSDNIKKIFFPRYLLTIPASLILLCIFSSYKIYDSYVKQNVLINDFNTQNFSTPIGYIDSIDDDFPNITATALPIKAIKANYYKNDSIVSRLLNLAILDNPYIKYPQALKAIRFSEIGNLDSALFFAKDAYSGISNNELHTITYMSILTKIKDSSLLDSVFNQSRFLKSANIWNAYLRNVLKLDLSKNSKRNKLFKESVQLFPKDERFEYLNKVYVMGDSLIDQTKAIFNSATQLFDDKKFLESAEAYLKGSKLDPKDPSFLENAGHAYYLNNNKNLALKLFDSVIGNYSNSNGKAYYFKGLILAEATGDLSESCRLFYIAKKRGNSDAEKAIELFCK